MITCCYARASRMSYHSKSLHDESQFYIPVDRLDLSGEYIKGIVDSL